MTNVVPGVDIQWAVERYQSDAMTREPLSTEQLGVMDSLLPTLQRLHETDGFIDGALPEDHVVYPGHAVTLGSYYMNSYDPNTLGKWQLRVICHDGTTSLKAIIDAMPDDVTDFSIGVVTEEGYKPATYDDLANVFSVLSPITAANVQRQAPKRQSVATRLGALARGIIGR